ncbi:histone chaperone asf1 [Pelomyxa schiedti]|nr:histone chaperone asf1 [Pelomyxa schiedti]
MSVVTVRQITVLDNPAKFTDPLRFDIIFDCLRDIPELEWKIVYVGSAETQEKDQVLACEPLESVPAGPSHFIFEADPPDPAQIPTNELLGLTVLLITCTYLRQELIRVGYFVYNEYDTQEMRMTPPPTPDVSHIMRNVWADKPRVTHFPMMWDLDQQVIRDLDGVAIPPPSLASSTTTLTGTNQSTTRPSAETAAPVVGGIVSCGTENVFLPLHIPGVDALSGDLYVPQNPQTNHPATGEDDDSDAEIDS